MESSFFVQSVKEIITCGDRLLNDCKSGSKEKIILNSLLKDLRARRTSGGGSNKLNPEEKTSSERKEKRESVEDFFYSEECVKNLGFSCWMILENDSSQQLSQGKSALKSLTNIFDFITIVLNSGIIPIHLFAPKPSFKFLKTTEATFFSKLFGSQRSLQFVSEHDADLPVENLRLLIVNGLISFADNVLLKDTSEKIVISYLGALLASAIPQHSRTTNDKSCSFLENTLCLHNTALLKIINIFFSLLVRPNCPITTSSEIRRMVLAITRSVTQKVESERRDMLSSEELSIQRENTTSKNARQTNFSEESADVSKEVHLRRVGEEDIVDLLGFCCVIVGKAPLAATSAAPTGSSFAIQTSVNVHLKDLEHDKLSTFSSNSTCTLLCFHMMLYIVVNGGPSLRNSLLVIESVKSSVIPVCIRSSVSDDFDVFKLALNILLTCCLSYGDKLFNEIYTIFKHVYFRVLESKITSSDQKELVIDSLCRYIEEPQNLIGLFLNYDCNSSSESIYEEMIHYLGSIARPPDNNPFFSSVVNSNLDSVVYKRLEPNFNSRLRRKCVQTLLLITESNIQWIERFDIEAKEQFKQSHSVETETNLEFVNSEGNDSTQTDSVHTQNELFLQARRYKDAFKKFLFIFNMKASPKEAIDFLIKSDILLLPIKERLEKEKEDAKSEISPSTQEPTIENVSGLSSSAAQSGNDSLEAETVAVFLKENEDYLDKITLGEYFAKSFSNMTARLVFQEWIQLHDFKNMYLDEALRKFLGGFKLLGEAQVVDRTMELFAGQYCSQNPSTFSSADTAFILSFSICMLNTDAHSPHVKNKMTLEGFIKNNRGIDEGKDVDPNILQGIYERITQREIVLRPSPKCTSSTHSTANNSNDSNEVKKNRSGILESIPILKHLSPIANAITDKVLLPIDSADIFGISHRKREEAYQQELRDVLKEVMAALTSKEGRNTSDIAVTASSIENALPMWEISVDLIVHVFMLAFSELIGKAESFNPSTSPNAESINAVTAAENYFKIPDNNEYLKGMLQGLSNIVRVCCAFGNSMQIEILLEYVYDITNISHVVLFSSKERQSVTITHPLSIIRVQLLSKFLDLFTTFGSYFTVRAWQAGFSALSLLDAIANGIDGLWKRQDKRFLFSKQKTEDGTERAHEDPAFYADTWFGNLKLVPSSIANDSWKTRFQILSMIRSVLKERRTVDAWIENFFDPTCYPPLTRLQMSNALAVVCEKELQNSRTFSLTKLFDYVTTCAPISTRLQWRDLWMNVTPVFISAGRMHAEISVRTLDGLRLIALSYLTREELLNYSFQKEVLRPFEEIFCLNENVVVRNKIIDIINELVDLRAAFLASGWHVVFTCLSKAAAVTETVEVSWRVCRSIVSNNIEHIKDCFADLVYSFATFVGSEVEHVALSSVSFFAVCGHWLQYGLDPIPKDIVEPEQVFSWATRLKTADVELRTSANLDIKYVKVGLSQDPLSVSNLLRKQSNSTSKTLYHLWISLFEGLVPIAIVHKSTRVRAHALSVAYSIFKFYGFFFDSEVQNSIVETVFKPVVITILNEPLSESGLAKMNYKLLSYLALKGLFNACSFISKSMLLLCSETLKDVVLKHEFSKQMIESDLVDVFIGISDDVIKSLELNPKNGTEQHLDALSDATVETVAVDLNNKSSFLNCLINESEQLGTFDIVSFKGTACWNELHASLVFSSGIHFPSQFAKDKEVREQLTNDVFECLQKAVAEVKRLFKSSKSDSSFSLVLFQCMRHVFLGLMNYMKSTRRRNPLNLLYDIVVVKENDETLLTEGVSRVYLLLIPFAWVCIDLIINEFENEEEYVLLRDELKNNWVRFIFQLSYSRQFCLKEGECINEPNIVESEGATSFLADGDELEKGKTNSNHRQPSFRDYFIVDGGEALKADVSNMKELFQTVYLMHLLSIHCTLSLFGEKSVLSLQEKSFLLDIISCAPSAIEETCLRDFFKQCWNEFNFHCDPPEKSIILVCVQLLQRNL